MLDLNQFVPAANGTSLGQHFYPPIWFATIGIKVDVPRVKALLPAISAMLKRTSLAAPAGALSDTGAVVPGDAGSPVSACQGPQLAPPSDDSL